MGNVIFKILEMSFHATLLILMVLLLRMVLKTIPKAIRCVLWALVGIRLICPVTIESNWSVLPDLRSYVQPHGIREFSVVQNGTHVDKVMKEYVFNGQVFGIDTYGIEKLSHILSGIWIFGMICMVCYAIVSYVNVHRKVREAVWWKENIWLCDHIDTPFILGIIRPRIYVPSALNEHLLTYVVAHERTHVRRRDNWWKPLGFALVCVYWFQPLVWIAYLLLCKDIELACDEQVIKKMDVADRRAYSMALLECSVSGKAIVTCPLAFGAVGVRERILAVLGYRKPRVLSVLVAGAVCVLVAVCFLTNPVGTSGSWDVEAGFADVG